ncbi:serine--tRNA ligase [Maricaulis sp.]|uniref:serine--tRNA ligase n=1 Tax=Maricaulis sp. TaxID=1486257 RepID=UPI00262A3971|nr:serine--tRNA ligase [Maricaulis sp.]
MLDQKFICANVDLVKEAARNKGVDVDIDRIVELDGMVRSLVTATEGLRHEKKSMAKQFSSASEDERKELQSRSKSLSTDISENEAQLRTWQGELRELLLITPNIPSEEAPIGPDADANEVVKTVGEKTQFDFDPLDHVDLLEKNDWVDFKGAAATAGSRTYCLKGDLVMLEMALMRFALDRLIKEGFKPITVPPYAREHAFVGTGHFPLHTEEAFKLVDDDFYMIGTSEVVLNNLHAGDILKDSDLPILYAGYSNCYRREAGSGGRDVRGLLRVHHFQKVEQYVICRNDPEESRKWHDTLLGISESLLSALELPYQIVACSTGDMGLGKIRMHDVETWVPSLDTYRETHSCSTLHDWQSRRTNTRYRDGDKKINFVHTLNNTAIATPRVFAPLLEIHQRKDGRFNVPKALRPYLGDRDIL